MNVTDKTNEDGDQRFAIELDASDFRHLNVPDLVNSPEQAKRFLRMVYYFARKEMDKQFPDLSNQGLSEKLESHNKSHFIRSTVNNFSEGWHPS